MPPEEIVRFLTDFTQKLIIWGSDEVVVRYSDFRQQLLKMAEYQRLAIAAGMSDTNAPASMTAEALLTFERLMYAMRADVGHKNKGFKGIKGTRDMVYGDLFSLFIDDIYGVINTDGSLKTLTLDNNRNPVGADVNRAP